MSGFSRQRKLRLPIRIERIYEPPDQSDGHRILVDRIWPRGVSKEEASVDAWLKEIAPSSELRQWFGHDASRWQEFKRRYFIELDARQDLIAEILSLTRDRTVTLVYSARDPDHNQAVALAAYLAAQAT
ncbi:MAG: DUF488 domain-containing protein [Geminicoccaceae bacterium]